MTDTERILFHKNYEYMWSKLNTTHYYVKGEISADYAADRITGGHLLPSYAICSRCHKEDYVPSDGTVRKIVNFYNCNLSPAVDRWQFLHENLSDSDMLRSKNGFLSDRRFLGTFYGYYISSVNSAKLSGAVLKIYEQDNIMKANMITGIRSDEELYGSALKELFQNTPVTKAQYDDYYNSPASEKHCSFYEGNLEFTSSSLLIVFRSLDSGERKLVLTLNTINFPPVMQKPYTGGLAFMLSTSASPFDTRFYLMGLINSTAGGCHLEDKRLPKLLKIRGTGNDILLTDKMDRAWFELSLHPDW